MAVRPLGASEQFMLPSHETGSGDTTLIFMPFLGGSQREWIETANLLGERYRAVTLDLPGFGAASQIPGYSVGEMCDALVESLAALNLGRYVLVGHSMAGKVSAVTTRRLLSNGSRLAPPNGLVLVAPSPPSPEPMSDAKRDEMLKSLGNPSQLRTGRYLESDRDVAEQFIRDNIAEPIADEVFKRTVDDVLKMNPAAWTAWLKNGSNEDWSVFVGVLELPTLIVAGGHDQALGPEAQRTHTVPHFKGAELVEVDSSHLIPLERPAELASLITSFLTRTGIAGTL